ncbi:hypothetical protein SAMN05518672_101469 [Chitinophaga sp. CF118]|uniref:hypothetical protein n=1 Tax=Chitinophaga sp. CF118 TaxID=1884367 RepID=UPI0008F15D03|nr:hypothetical protein [Chitinophaga sp. CF118]SFD09975.1 hypothetical protein SAMN05518672_101469 [Chitinophaga sp. CF118]
MRGHNGMRPQDVVILLEILTIEGDWQYRDLSTALSISISEISESLHRSYIAGLIDEAKRKVYRMSLMEFIHYGLHYVFPQVPGQTVTGIPTAHSHPFYKEHFSSESDYVWPDNEGTTRGLMIEPLYKNVIKAVKDNEQLYKLLASLDIIRVGKNREKKLALEELRKIILV